MFSENIPYSMSLDKEYTVEEIISKILNENPNKYGTICIDEYQIKTGFGNPSCIYRRGTLESQISEYYLKQTIKEVKYCSCWGNVDYIIILK